MESRYLNFSRTWMEIIFETLEPNLVSLLEYGVKSDPT